MSDWPTQEDLKPENNMTFKRIASVIGCNADIISDAWVNLGLDALDDPNELRDLRRRLRFMVQPQNTLGKFTICYPAFLTQS